MIYLDINKLEPGYKLAEDLYNENGAVMLREGSLLTPFTVEKIKSFGIKGIYVENGIDSEIKVQPLISNNFRIRLVDYLQRLSITSTVYSASDVVEYVMVSLKTNSVSLDYIESRPQDKYLLQHSVAVAEIAVLIGKALTLDERALEDLATCALLHDVGQLVSRRDLAKTLDMKLNDKDEDFLYRMHPFFGYSYLSNFPEVKATVRNGVLFHHINEDLNGFPEQISKERRKPYIFAKIIQVADAYDQARYKDGKNDSIGAIEYLKDNIDTLFNKTIVATLFQYVPKYPVGTLVNLSTGEEAIVYEQNKRTDDTNKILNHNKPKVIIYNGPRKGTKINLLENDMISIIDNNLEKSKTLRKN